MKNWRLLNSLKRRGLSTALLAQQIGSCRTHVSQVLANTPGRGGNTRRKLAPLLTVEELALAGWGTNGEIVPRGTMSQPEQTRDQRPETKDFLPAGGQGTEALTQRDPSDGCGEDHGSAEYKASQEMASGEFTEGERGEVKGENRQTRTHLQTGGGDPGPAAYTEAQAVPPVCSDLSHEIENNPAGVCDSGGQMEES